MASKASKPAPAALPGALVAATPLRVDGADVAPGEAFVTSPAVADALLASGAATLPIDVPA